MCRKIDIAADTWTEPIVGEYTFKLYRRHQRNTSPGRLVARFVFVAEDDATAIAKANADHASALAESHYAFISREHGRIVWEARYD